MSAIVYMKSATDTVGKIFNLGDDRASNLKKILLNALAIISYIGVFFTQKMGLGPYAALSMAATGTMLFYASYKTQSKNRAADKISMRYLDFPRTKEDEEAIKTITDGIALRGGYWAIFKKAPELYRAGDKIHYHESNGKIHGVHTLRFLGYIFSKKDLAQNMKTLFGYTGLLSIVKSTYISRISEVLEGLYKDNQIVPHLKDLVDEISKDYNMSKPRKKELIEKLTNAAQKDIKNKWGEFIQTLIDYTT